MHHPHAISGVEIGERASGTKRIFFVTQVAQHRNQEVTPWRCLAPVGTHRLMDHPCLGPVCCVQFVQAFLLQHQQVIGQIQASQRPGIAANVAVQVGAGKCQHQRALRVSLFPGEHRRATMARVQGDHRVLIAAVPIDFHIDFVAQCAQMRGPAHSGVAIPMQGAGFGRRYNDPMHTLVL